MRTGTILERLINLFVGLAVGILAIRVLFRLFNASANSSFVNWIYETSDTLMSPFRGVFPPQEVVAGYVLDVSALFSMLMYALIGFVLAAVLALVPQSSVKKK